jgi:DNA segregation ATPase FtsK/SpoIIIE-like protein
VSGAEDSGLHQDLAALPDPGRVMLMVDEVDELIRRPDREAIARLLRLGRKSGVHVTDGPAVLRGKK